MSSILIELSVSGMTCGGCERHLQRTLDAAPGVLEVHEVSYKEERAVVLVNADADLPSIAQASTDIGYAATVVGPLP